MENKGDDVLTSKDRDIILSAIRNSANVTNEKIDTLSKKLDETNSKVANLEKIDAENRLTAIEKTIKEFQDAKTALDHTKVDIENTYIMHDLQMKDMRSVKTSPL